MKIWKYKMADSRHFGNRKYALTRPQIVWSSPNIASRRRNRCKFGFFTNSAKIRKSKMADGRHFENRKYSITRPLIVRSSPNFAGWRINKQWFEFLTNVAKILKSKMVTILKIKNKCNEQVSFLGDLRGGTWSTWSSLWKNRQAKQKPKLDSL